MQKRRIFTQKAPILLKNGHFLRHIKTIKIAIFRWATTPW